MARDPGLEELLAEQLDGMAHVSSKALFGGWCWLVRGHLVCGARHDGLLVRLGPGGSDWALQKPGVSPMMVGPRLMPGWVRLQPEAFADDAFRHACIETALAFVSTLPDKPVIATSAQKRQA